MGRSSSPLTRLPIIGFVLFNRSNNNSLWWRTCQLVAMTTALVSLYTFILLYISVTSIARQQKPRQVMWLRKDQLKTPPESHLIDLIDFHYVQQPRERCLPTENYPLGSGIYFLIYVHSSPDHFKERQTIRSTWGSVHNLSQWGIRVIYLLGLTTPELQNKVNEENRLNGDLVQGNFVDSYRNLSYKHLMGYKWILSNCPKVSYIVKVDDDSFVDIFQLYKFLRNVYGPQPSGILACSVWPAGSSPQREQGHKWAVNLSEYPYDVYPAYCGGLAYVVTPDVAQDILSASPYVPFFWIDDLYVTGLIVETLPHIRHYALNLRTTYNISALISWLSEKVYRPCPYFFGDVSGGSRNSIMQKLWQKSEKLS